MADLDSDRRTRNRDSWSRYWAAHPTHSLPGTFDADYGHAIAGFWKSVCSALPPHPSILDIATGNGPLPRMMLNWRSDLRIDAIDAANVAIDWPPPASAPPPVFHSGVSCEALPFPAGRFDLVTSQYGIEYSDLEDSLGEVARTLRDGGLFAAVMHSADSRITTVTREELGHVQLLLANGAAMDCLMSMVPLLAVASTPAGIAQLNADAGARATRERFNTAMNEVKEAALQASVPEILVEFLQWAPHVLALAGQCTSPNPALYQCRQYRQQLEDASERYRALLSAALDEKMQQDLLQRLTLLGFQITDFRELEQEGHRLGIALTARSSLRQPR